MNDTIKTQKTPTDYYCEYCDFNCFKLSDWTRHLSRPKHLNNKKGYNLATNDTKKTQKTPAEFICKCGKYYQYHSGLWRHKKVCSGSNVSLTIMDNNTQQLTPDIVFKLIEQNKELQQTLIDQNKTIIELAQKSVSQTNTTNTNCGNNNKTFNLQVFLNETCKDAINMSDFVNQIQVSLSELEDTGRLGYAEGISKVFINKLNDINDQERPLHCSDSKREIIYIKENNQWMKDDENKSSLMNAIKIVANKNIKQISEWQKAHPKFSDPSSKENDKYMNIVLYSMSGSTKEECEKNYEKIQEINHYLSSQNDSLVLDINQYADIIDFEGNFTYDLMINPIKPEPPSPSSYFKILQTPIPYLEGLVPQERGFHWNNSGVLNISAG